MSRLTLVCLSVVISACAETIVPTEVVFEIDAEDLVQERMKQVELQVWSAQSDYTCTDASCWTRRLDHRIPQRDVIWPMRFPVLPLYGDSDRVFEVIARALDAEGNVLLEQRAVSSFVRRSRQTIKLTLEDLCVEIEGECVSNSACHGPLCNVCRKGGCEETGIYGADESGVLVPGSVDGGMSGDAGQAPAGCSGDSWDDDGRDETPCVPRSRCGAGEYVTAPGSSRADRRCADCEQGWFSTVMNADACMAWSVCAAGTYVANTPSSVEDASCAACGVGQYCAGADAAPVACGGDSWDHDADPFTACAPTTPCLPGQYVSGASSPVVDRSCAPCAAGRFSGATNAESCTVWSTCRVGDAETSAGSSTKDRTCATAPWTVQFGTTAADEVRALYVDRDQNVYLAGTTGGALDGASAGSADAFVSKLDRSGKLLWTRQLGSSAADAANALAVAGDRVYVAGESAGILPGSTSDQSSGFFLALFSDAGKLLWSRQQASALALLFPGLMRANAVGLEASGDVVVAGSVTGALPGVSSAGLIDGFLCKYTGDGKLLWTQQFGTSGDDDVNALAFDQDGNFYIAGRADGSLATSPTGGDGLVARYDVRGKQTWLQQFGAAQTYGEAVAIDAGSGLYVAGYTYSGLAGQSLVGAGDAFVRRYDLAGKAEWTRQFGSPGSDRTTSLAVDALHEVYAVSEVKGLLGEVYVGQVDVLVQRYDATGKVVWVHQFGTGGDDRPSATALDTDGFLYIAGSTNGALADHPSAGLTDAFVMKLDPRRSSSCGGDVAGCGDTWCSNGNGGSTVASCVAKVCVCPIGSSCSTNNQCNGTCVAATCTASNTACDDDDDCRGDAKCVKTALNVTGTCLLPDGKGPCIGDAQCQHICRAGSCGQPGASGESCAENADCKASLVCRAAGAGGLRCATLGGIGDVCDEGADCGGGTVCSPLGGGTPVCN